MTWYRRYKALFQFNARSDAELSMSPEETLLVKKLPDGSWPPAEKWMQGYNEITGNSGEFPGGAYVEFVVEFVHSLEVEPSPPPVSPPPPELDHWKNQAPSVPSPRHSLLQQKLPGMDKAAQQYSSRYEPDNDQSSRGNRMAVAQEEEEEEAPPPPPRRAKPSENHVTSRGSLPQAPPRPAPRAKRPSVGSSMVASPTHPTAAAAADIDRHRWVSVTFSIPVLCVGCKFPLPPLPSLLPSPSPPSFPSPSSQPPSAPPLPFLPTSTSQAQAQAPLLSLFPTPTLLPSSQSLECHFRRLE